MDGTFSRYLDRIASRARERVEVDDVAITRFAPPDRWQVACATTPAVAALEDWGFSVSDGPTWDAVRRHQTVVVADLTAPATPTTWPLWSQAAEAYGSVAVVPVDVGIVTLGALSVYRREARPFTAVQLERVAALADAVVLGLLDELTGEAAEAAAAGGPGPREFLNARVYQASGMVMVQLGLDAANALVALRAHAFARTDPRRDLRRRRRTSAAAVRRRRPGMMAGKRRRPGPSERATR